jgi:hypothetical protein
MKFREREMKNELYDEIRYNRNTIGTHENISQGNNDPEKKCCAAISIFSLMTICHYYEKAESEIAEKTPNKILDRMFANASVVVGDSIQTEEVEILR